MDAPVNPGPWMESGREAGLVLLAQKGDRPAFFELLREYQRPLYRLCFAFTREHSAAANLAHESALHAWRGLRHLPVGRPFFPWLARIARNLAVTRQRRRAGDQPSFAARVRPNGEAWNDPSYPPEAATLDPAVLRAYADLGPDEQMLLALRLVEQLHYAALGNLTETQVGHVMHRLAGVRERLATALPAEPREDAA